LKYAVLVRLYRLFFCICLLQLFAQKGISGTRVWNGGATGIWSVATNWIPAGVPDNTDSVVFDGDIAPTVSLNSFPAGRFTFLQVSILHHATVTITASASVEVGLDRGIFIEAGSRLNLGGITTTKFQINLAASGNDHYRQNHIFRRQCAHFKLGHSQSGF
jgi:hypothetical protein